MSDFVSAYAIVENDFSGQIAKAVKEEVFDIDLRIKKAMDGGLSPEEMAVAQQVRAATMTALDVVEKLSTKQV